MLAPGNRLGVYEITAPLGAGGMGEVYRAHDTALNRTVAIKVLPDALVADPERVARFEREAQFLAAVNHPHIATIYGVERAGGAQFLVLEFIDGETVADKLKARNGKPLDLDEALALARQIADALQAAHDKGIVHRDLKPANIAVTHDGVVKILDFGLASVPVAFLNGQIEFGHATPLLSQRYVAGSTGLGLDLRGYDVSPDGRRFLVVKEPPPDPADAQRETGIVAVVDWTRELNGRGARR